MLPSAGLFPGQTSLSVPQSRSVKKKKRGGGGGGGGGGGERQYAANNWGTCNQPMVLSTLLFKVTLGLKSGSYSAIVHWVGCIKATKLQI